MSMNHHFEDIRSTGEAVEIVQDSYTISQLCREFDITHRTLRFYEQKKLLHPTRRKSARIYSYIDRARLEFILRCKQWGFTLADITDLLKLADEASPNVSELVEALPQLDAQLLFLKSRQSEVEAAITDLEQVCSLLHLRGSLPEPNHVADGSTDPRDARSRTLASSEN